MSESPVFRFVTVQISVMPAARWSSSGADAVKTAGGLIQLSGLYEPPSECTRIEPSAFSMSTRGESGRWAERRPA